MGLVAAFLVLSAGASPANAHADLVSSYPQAGQRLAELPKYVEVKFNESLIQLAKTKVNVIEVRDSSGVQIDDGKSVTSGPVVKVNLNMRTVHGEVRVNWRVVSGDGHPLDGSFKFDVGSTIVPTAKAPVIAKKEVSSNSFFEHKKNIVYSGLGLLIILAWAMLSVRMYRRKGRK